MAVKILIPYNFTQNDEKAINFVGHRYKDEKDVEITLFHAYSPVPEIDVKDNPILEKMKANVSFLRQQKQEHKQALEKARERLATYGFAKQNIHCIFQPLKADIAMDIIRLWKNENFDVVVLNRNPGSIMNFFSRSISKKITQYYNGNIGVHLVN